MGMSAHIRENLTHEMLVINHPQKLYPVKISHYMEIYYKKIQLAFHSNNSKTCANMPYACIVTQTS